MAFSVGPVPIFDNPELQQFADIVWEKLQDLESLVNYLEIEEVHYEPEAAVEGMMVYADGTDWDPGSGQGLYRWSGTAWVKI
jgi:hypothetical protein